MANKRKLSTSMETTLEKSDSENIHVEEKKVKSNGDEDDAEIKKEGDVMLHVKQEENGIKEPSSMVKDLTSIDHEAQIISAKAKIDEVREENERLKQLITKIAKDHQSLQKYFFSVAEEVKRSTKVDPTHEENEETELVSLSLGRSSSEPRKEEKKSSNLSDGNEKLNISKGLSLGLDNKFEPDNSIASGKNTPSSENSFDEEEPAETWPPSKVLKTSTNAEDEALQQTQMKKTRVLVRTRCDTPTMNDGCQWRKYGQKIAKANPCPRAYYRCTISPTCPVRKQVQRCAEDMTILMTTYEGTHNHPLPRSATAMASTTSAAASMLQSRSSTSQQGSMSTSISGLNFTLAQNSKPQQFYFPNSSVISNSTSHPTITLDLATSNFNRFSSAPRYSPTCLNFSSSSCSLDSNTNLQTMWNHVGYQTYNRNHRAFSLMQLNNQLTSSSDQQSLTENIAAATKVIAANPNFQSALVAAMTSVVSNGGGGVVDQHGGLSLKVGHDQSLAFNKLYSSNNGIGCGSSYLNRSPAALSSHQQQGSLVLFPNSSPFSATKNASGSPRDPNRD